MINAKVLQNAAKQAVKVTGGYSHLSMLRYAVVSSNGAGLVLWATNLDYYYSALLDKDAGPIPSQILDPRNLVEILRPTKGEINLTVDDTGLHLGSATLASVIDPEEYPAPLKLSDVQHIATLDGKQFKQSIKRLFNQAQKDTDTRRIHLTGICFQSKNNELVLTATQGHVLESDTLEIRSDVASEHTLPAKILKKVVSGIGVKAKVRIAAGKYADMEFVRIQSGDDTYHVKAIPDEYPNFQRLFRDHEDNYHCTVHVKEFLDTLRQALPSCPEKSANAVRLDLNNFELTITAENDAATFEHVLNVSESYGSQFADYYNCKLLIGILKDLARDNVVLSFSGLHKAMKFESDGIQGLLMPVRMEA